MLRTFLSLSFLLLVACCMHLQAQSSCAKVNLCASASKQVQADDTKASSTLLLVAQEAKSKTACQSGTLKASAIVVSNTGASCNPSQCLPKDCDPKDCDPTECDLSKCLPSGAKARLAGNEQGVQPCKVQKEGAASSI